MPATLAPSHHRDDRPGRPIEGLPERGDLRREEGSRARCGGVADDPRGGCMRPVGGTERIHHEDVAGRGHPPREGLVVLGLAREEAHVLGERELPGGRHRPLVRPPGRYRDRTAERLPEPRGDRSHGQRGVEAPRGRPAEVGHHGERRPCRQRLLEGREGRPDAGRVRDLPAREGHVQVRADQHPPPREVEVRHARDRGTGPHGSGDSRFVRRPAFRAERKRGRARHRAHRSLTHS